MTGPVMNAPERKKMTRVGAVLAMALAACACVSRFDPGTDQTSPVAPRVAALVAANKDYPRWEDFPAAPVDLPEPAAIAAEVNTLRVTSGALAGEVSRIDWDLSDPAGFAASVISRIDASKLAPVTAATEADIEDFARRLRERAKAPPPVDRR